MGEYTPSRAACLLLVGTAVCPWASESWSTPSLTAIHHGGPPRTLKGVSPGAFCIRCPLVTVEVCVLSY